MYISTSGAASQLQELLLTPFLPIQIHSAQAPSPKSILIQAIPRKLYATWANPLQRMTLPPPVNLPSTDSNSFTIYTKKKKRDGGMKWQNREEDK